MEPAETPTIVFLTRDLFFTSQVGAVVERLGARFQTVGDPSDVVAVAGTSCRGLLIDLSLPGLQIGELMAAFSTDARPRVIAFGPHVQIGRLEAARQAGCDEVLPRGRFSAELTAIVERCLRS